MNDKRIYATKPQCKQCGGCCKKQVCYIGLVMLATDKTPCPALEYKDGKYWCGLVINPSKFIFRNLYLTVNQYQLITKHILHINNFGEGCDLKEWKLVKQEAKK